MRQLRHKAITGGFWGSRGLFLKKNRNVRACLYADGNYPREGGKLGVQEIRDPCRERQAESAEKEPGEVVHCNAREAGRASFLLGLFSQ